MQPRLSIIIPTLNEAGVISRTLTNVLQRSKNAEIIVVDAGSTDATRAICASFDKVKVLQSEVQQRAAQMNLGANAAVGEYLMFLHADTIPPDGFEEMIHRCLDRAEVSGGSFALSFDVRHWMLGIIAGATRLNLPLLTFGDHGMFLRKSDFKVMRGFKALPILEDFDLQLRLRRAGVFARPQASVLTSARRFVNNGIFRQSVINFCILSAYLMGVRPAVLTRYYPNSNSAAR